ncbi:hypothetical protein DPMN_183930 [Dreissena polymorpha]|uniref:Uncharacterized protein n=1 Tax=Dreissena polymorpha TaxID=45954 RepID=A0A9D4DGX0_DREPO|nr:hypothetical protein DPMN_183930 [Dreissena polymorpha]
MGGLENLSKPHRSCMVSTNQAHICWGQRLHPDRPVETCVYKLLYGNPPTKLTFAMGQGLHPDRRGE